MTNDTLPLPIVFSPSQTWDGNDGSWSTFVIRMGTPEQTFNILPSTAGQETWIPVPDGCTANDPSNCGELRGVYPFQGHASSGFSYNSSSTWKLIGLYDLVTEQNLGYIDNGMYGFDTVGLMLPNSGGVSLTNQVVAGIATKDFYLGVFGLGPKPSNFSDFENPQPSFMTSLKDQNRIPSLSFGYTAGAPYRIPKQLGSLTLGGYDESRFSKASGSTTFPFGTDDSRVLSIGIQTITAMNTPRGTVTLTSDPILTLIDSTVSQLWLPRAVCDQFEQTFGLTYDNTTGLYLVNDTIHSNLQKSSPNIVISLGNDDNPAEMVSITLPYAAFDLQASYPIYSQPTNYFPIRRAANDSQYTLGRTFLQEAYVIADYERQQFWVHQALFNSSTPNQTITTIYPPGLETNQTTPNGKSPTITSTSHKLSKGALAGIIVGAIAGLILLVGAFLILFFRQRNARKAKELKAQETRDAKSRQQNQDLVAASPHELFHAPEEVAGSKVQFEVHAHEITLISDDAVRHELPGSEVQSEPDRSEIAQDEE